MLNAVRVVSVWKKHLWVLNRVQHNTVVTTVRAHVPLKCTVNNVIPLCEYVLIRERSTVSAARDVFLEWLGTRNCPST